MRKIFPVQYNFHSGSIGFIIIDILRWVNIRKGENDSISQAAFFDPDMILIPI